MKKLILLCSILVLLSPKVYSQIFVENFDYPVIPLPTLLSTTAPWEPISAPGTLPIIVDIPTGLTYPNYAGSGIGNAVTVQDLGGEDDTARFTGAIPTSGSVYASFMLSGVSATPTGEYFFALMTEGNAQDMRVYARSSGLGYNLGIQKATGSTIDYTTEVYSFLATYLVVAKYTFVAGAINDQVSLFVFDISSPPPNVEPTPTLGPITPVAGTDAPELVAALLRQGSATLSAEVIIDGIYVDNIWNETILPVELSSFTSTISGRNVTLNWSTASELNNSGFDIERRSLNNEWSRIGNVTGNGTTTIPHNYSFIDRGLATGSYNYRLKQIDFNGNFEYLNLNNEIRIGVPSNYQLSQNYPNPFNPSTKIDFDLPNDGNVNIKLFDMSGSEVSTLINETRIAGYHTINFNASHLSSGVYFYTIRADNSGQSFVATKKMLLVK